MRCRWLLGLAGALFPEDRAGFFFAERAALALVVEGFGLKGYSGRLRFGDARKYSPLGGEGERRIGCAWDGALALTSCAEEV